MSVNIGTEEDALSYVYKVSGGTPEQNMERIISMMGGMNSIVDRNDIVILKPNAQWWNQGMTNTNAMKQFIEDILNIPGYSGEIIIAENHHFPEDNSRGWTTTEKNGDFNYNELIEYFNKQGFKNVTKYHWHDAGLSNSVHPSPKTVSGPEEGDGYVWRRDITYVSPQKRKSLMTYPVFTSSYSNITIDLKHGAWKTGKYINTPIKLINFSALNHHGYFAGVTGSIKNLMGIVDLSCGYNGSNPEGFFNTHYIGYENLAHKIGTRLWWGFNRRKIHLFAKLAKRVVLAFGNFDFHHTGGLLGFWMRNIRKPDVNIITAENIGYGSRTDPELSVETKTILASEDPIALDYYAAKHVLLPGTKMVGEKGLSYIKYNDPDLPPFHSFLVECQKHIGGVLNEDFIQIHEHFYCAV